MRVEDLMRRAPHATSQRAPRETTTPTRHGTPSFKRMGRAMPDHKFRIGEIVFLTPSLDRNVPGGAYVVTRQLPEQHGEFEYRIRSVHEPHERVARESELKKKM